MRRCARSATSSSSRCLSRRRRPAFAIGDRDVSPGADAGQAQRHRLGRNRGVDRVGHDSTATRLAWPQGQAARSGIDGDEDVRRRCRARSLVSPARSGNWPARAARRGAARAARRRHGRRDPAARLRAQVSGRPRRGLARHADIQRAEQSLGSEMAGPGVAAQAGDDMVVVDDLSAPGAGARTRGSSATRSEPRNPPGGRRRDAP
jgi:hypothetical protein